MIARVLVKRRAVWRPLPLPQNASKLVLARFFLSKLMMDAESMMAAVVWYRQTQ
jgi:hypothetical protein